MSSLTQNPKTLRARVVSGSIVLLSGSGLATAVNMAYNVAVARFLGPTGFGHATVVYTLLTLISAVTLSFQIISAKVVAQQDSPEGKAAVYRGFHKSSWACGIVVALTLLLFQRAIADYLNLPSPVLVAILAIGAAFYVPLGSRRGYIQGSYGFRGLAVNLVLEGMVRLGGSLLLVFLGFGVNGVIAANAAAVAVAYLALAPRLAGRIPNPLWTSYAIRETSQALIFFAGQVLINNCDIVLVKHFFPSKMAGVYAAVAMVGRVIYSFSSAVVNSMFPLVAGGREEERKDLTVIATSLTLVLGVGSVLAFGLRIWEVQPTVPAGDVRHHHCDLLAQRRDHHVRDVLQDREHELGAVGLQWSADRGHLRIPFDSSAGHPGSVGLNDRSLRSCGIPIPCQLVDRPEGSAASGELASTESDPASFRR